MARQTETRRLELTLAEFAGQALTAQAARYEVSEERLIQQAVRHWRTAVAADRPAARVPRFRPAPRPEETTPVTVRLETGDWDELEEAAEEQGIPLEQLLVHAVVLFLADLDSGRVAAEIALSEDAGEDDC